MIIYVSGRHSLENYYFGPFTVCTAKGLLSLYYMIMITSDESCTY